MTKRTSLMPASMPTSVPQARSPRVAELLTQVRPRGRVIFGLDATASRQPTWDTAARLTADMFAAAAGLEMQVCYYRGIAECRSSRWTSSAQTLAQFMATIICRAGETQIARVLEHIRQEHQRQPINAAIFIGDACEEAAIVVQERARLLTVPLFLFQENHDAAVAELFRSLAEITHGAYATFDANASERLAELLRAVVAYASDGLTALAAQKTSGGQLLLGQLKKGN